MTRTKARSVRRQAAPRWALLAALAVPPGVTLATEAAAQVTNQAVVEGHVVAVQSDEVIIDLAGARGAQKGDHIELWRPIVLRHPVTRQRIRDRFPIGTITLNHVGEHLARATDRSALEREPEAGDIAILRREVVAQPAPPPQRVAMPAGRRGSSGSSSPPTAVVKPSAPEPPALAGSAALGSTRRKKPAKLGEKARDALEVAELFEALRGAPVVKRIKAYEAWIRRRPQSAYAPVLYEEAALLRNAVELHQRQRGRRGVELSVTVEQFTPPEEALPGQPLTLAMRLRGRPKAVLLHVRTTGQPSFESLPVRHAGRDYYSVTLPSKRVEEPSLEFFIEATDGDGELHQLFRNAKEPQRIDVRAIPLPVRWKPPRATVTIWTDYADYNRFRGNDTAWQTEGYFGMRFGETGVRALRSGFGVYRGVGGSLEELDELELSPRRVGITYGYLEGEAGFHELFSLLARPVVGLADGGITGGGLVAVRIGNDLRTNLQLGGDFLGTVGIRGFAQFELKVFENWPMMIRSEVTTQPAGSESSTGSVRPDLEDALPENTAIDTNGVGVRGIAQVGYRIVDSLVVSARGSYQGRTINHSGPGFGGAISYSW